MAGFDAMTATRNNIEPRASVVVPRSRFDTVPLDCIPTRNETSSARADWAKLCKNVCSDASGTNNQQEWMHHAEVPTERACLAKQATATTQKAQICVEAAHQKFGSEATVTLVQETRTTQKCSGASSTSSTLANVLNSPISHDPDPTHQLLFATSLAERGNREIVLDLLWYQLSLESMADKKWVDLQVLKDAAAASAEDWTWKFARGILLAMAFGGLSVFFGGLEAFIGSPSARVLEAIIHEHCEEKDSSIEFTTGNYGATATSKTEWLFAASPGGGPKQVSLHQWPREQNVLDSADIAKCRKVRTSAELDLIMDDLNSKMKKAEQGTLTREGTVGGVLYTAPIFVKYNAVNRGGALSVQQCDYTSMQFRKTCPGNRYVTTIRDNSSGLLNLSKLGEAVTVCRSFSGEALP